MSNVRATESSAPSAQSPTALATSASGAIGTVNKANATVTANSSTVTYNGSTYSINGFTVSGLAPGESAAVLTGVSTSGGTGKDAGSYVHSASGTAGNYNLTFVDGALTINKAALAITGNSDTKTYNAAQQSVSGFTVNSGLQGDDTIADLLGNPLPADLVNAQDMAQIRIAWRAWLGMRVKIVDEYNRIPTRTQSALLTVMGDNYAEVLNQVYECPESAWYLTANDEQGGGTYEVIEALRDRIDVVVQALAFNPRFLDELLVRIEEDVRPEELMPRELVFTDEEVDRMGRAIRAVEVPDDVRRRVEFFASQFELAEMAGGQFEYMTKDTARLSGIAWHELAALDNGRDRMKDLGCQTLNGLSVRNLMTLLLFAKALAWFRGNPQVELDDVRQILPFVLHDKLRPDPDAPFFALPENGPYRSDRVSWLRRLFDLASAEYARLDLDRNDAVGQMANEFAQGLDGVSERETRARLVRIEKLIGERVKGRKLYGHLYDDLLKLKYLHQRYTNYLAWLRAQA